MMHNAIKKNFFFASLATGGFFLVLFFSPASAMASTNLTNTVSPASTSWGWNDIVGWINFNTYANITVSATQLTGYASSSIGPISLDCGTSPAGNICSSGNGNYKVVNASGTAVGNLSGWAWNDTIGWTTFFWGNASSSPASTSTYNSACNSYPSYCGVSVDQYGNFQGAAWNDLIGWIYFNHSGTGWGFAPLFSVATTWAPTSTKGMLDSTTFDTGVANGVAFNSITWQGSLNACASCSVGIQLAVSTSSSGPWNFGPSTPYTGNPGTIIPITNYAAYSGYRYFRYRVILTTNTSQSLSPTVNSVSVDWSP